MKAPLRLLLRALALGGAGLGTFYVAAQWSCTGMEAGAAEEIVGPAAPARAPIVPQPQPAASAAAAAASVPAAAASRAVPSGDGQAFARLTWVPRPPPPVPAPPAPPARVVPTAPPLPFSFVGMVENGMGKPQAFLAKGDALLVVSAGELLENNTYRVDSLDANQVVLTYLPLSIKQTIDVSGASK